VVLIAVNSKGLRVMPGSLRIELSARYEFDRCARASGESLDATVFEQPRFSGIEPVSIHPNAARLLKRIGLDDQHGRSAPNQRHYAAHIAGRGDHTPAGPATPAFSQDVSGYMFIVLTS